jgi:N-acetylglucosaminyldiphosphoundecaprenol N-acetyl-beta-D-mannosaminyltransferase
MGYLNKQSSSESMEKINTKICQLDNIDTETALMRVQSMSRTEKLNVVVTPNIDHLTRLCDSEVNVDFEAIYQQCDLCLCDSNVFEKLLRIKGKKVKEVIPGSTLTAKLFAGILSSDDSVLIIGGEDSVISRLRELYPKLIIDHYNPPMGFIQNEGEVEKTLQYAENSGANYFFLAIGSPRQEIIAKKLKDREKVKGVALCIGASILFIVGEEHRAPKFFQSLHLEWFYRMIQSPARLAPRYVKNFLALPGIFRHL